jgi:RNA polymerase sigma-70 factor (family 1)
VAEERQETLSRWSRKLKDSDKSAFSALFRALYPDLRWYARRLTGDDEAAEDIVQETFIRLWDKRAAIDPERSVRAFLYVAVRRRAFNEDRDTRTRKTLSAMMDEPEKPTRPDEAIDTRLVGQHIRKWIDELPDRRREAFELSRFCGLSYQEIARVMGLSVHTVEKHITNALKYLRQRLRDYDPDLLKP